MFSGDHRESICDKLVLLVGGQQSDADEDPGADEATHWLMLNDEQAAAFEFKDMSQMHRVLDELNRQVVNSPRGKAKKKLMKKQKMMDAMISQQQHDAEQNKKLQKSLKNMRTVAAGSGTSINELLGYRPSVQDSIKKAAESAKYCQGKFEEHGPTGKNHWVADALETLAEILRKILADKVPLGALAKADDVLCCIEGIFEATAHSAGGWEQWLISAFDEVTLDSWQTICRELKKSQNLAVEAITKMRRKPVK